jgi:hypothetical protein
MFKLSFGVNAASMMVTNTIFLDILTLFNSPQFGWNLFFNVVNNVINAASYGVAALLPEPKEPTHEAFTEVGAFDDSLTFCQEAYKFLIYHPSSGLISSMGCLHSNKK